MCVCGRGWGEGLLGGRRGGGQAGSKSGESQADENMNNTDEKFIKRQHWVQWALAGIVNSF